jgi:hypothetical protein
MGTQELPSRARAFSGPSGKAEPRHLPLGWLLDGHTADNNSCLL